jgi:hypothetical protein
MLTLRPHHLIDIVASIGNGDKVQPHPYGHAVHTVTRLVPDCLDAEVRFVIGADDICAPCVHLGKDGRCDDVLRQLNPPISKQDYNDGLDTKLFALLGLKAKPTMTVREFLVLIGSRPKELERVCAHPKEDAAGKTRSIRAGLTKLGVALRPGR